MSERGNYVVRRRSGPEFEHRSVRQRKHTKRTTRIQPADQTEDGDVHVRRIKSIEIEQIETVPEPLPPPPPPAPPKKIEVAIGNQPVVVEEAVVKPPRKPIMGPLITRVRNRLMSLVRRHPRRTAAIGAGVLLIVVGLAIWSVAGAKNQSSDPASQTAHVAQLANIQGDSNPVVLSVLDASKVDQPFLEGTQNGDKVYLFYLAKKAVVYRPSSNQVVKNGVFTPPAPKVFIRNGTAADTTAGIKAVLGKNRTLYSLISTDQSAQSHYSETLVIDLNNRYPDSAQSLATSLGARVGSLPPGETRPDADLLVITGSK
jgi:hypothetical protein